MRMDIKSIELERLSQTFRLEQLPSIDFEDRNQLPEVAGIYFAIDSNDNIQYIGQSMNIRNRLRTHNRKQQLSELSGVRIAYLEVSDTSLLNDIEQALIDYFDPFLNGTSNYRRNKYKPDRVVVSTYLTQDVKDAFARKCEAEGMSIASKLRQHIIQLLNNSNAE